MTRGQADDKTGRKFGRLTAVEYIAGGKWLCKCECGETRIVRTDKLTSGIVTACRKCSSNFKDISGMKFGRLTVIEHVGNNCSGHSTWLCRCDCGKEKIVRADVLKNGETVSCGCLSREKHITHEGTGERLFGVWRDMRNRCYNPNRESYKHYGAKGVCICDEWRDDYPKFREWALANGYDENAPRGQCTIDRINPFGNYEPSNCRWADAKTQARNRRRDYARKNNLS